MKIRSCFADVSPQYTNMTCFAPLFPRSLLQVSGPDSHDFLQGLITNDMKGAVPGSALYAALLTPQGKVMQAFFVMAQGDHDYLVDCPADEAEALFKRLRMFKLRAAVEITARDDVQIALSEAAIDADICVPDPRAEGLGFRCVVPAGEELPAAPDSWQAARMAAMVPEQGVDFDNGEVFPSDINMDLQNGVAMRKGCYVGQEVVSRMKRRGTIRKRTLRVVFEGAAAETGAEIIAGPARLGAITSTFGNSALAQIRTDRLASAQEKDETITCDGHAVQVDALVEG